MYSTLLRIALRASTCIIHPQLVESRHEGQFVCFFVCFVALRPKSTAMVIAGRSVHLTTLFPGQA